MVRLAVIAALACLLLPVACFDASLPEAFTVACRDGGDCVDDTVCLLRDDVGQQRCVRSNSACIDVDVSDRTARALPDGSGCGDERICVAAACVAPRCGDGVVTAPEDCDGDGGCRPDCTRARCGDGVVDDGESCDDGDVDSGDGCRGDCAKIEVCGDGVVDDGEGCDDANGNPRDGCDGCRRQRWSSALLVSGAVEPREGPRTALTFPHGVAVDVLGRLFIADTGSGRVRRVDVDGTITTIAGTGEQAFSGDGGPASSAALSGPTGIAIDSFGRVLIADSNTGRVRRVEVNGTIQTIAGTGESDFSGDGGPATRGALKSPGAIAIDALGRVLIADTGNNRIRRVELDDTITTIAGTGEEAFFGDGGDAARAALRRPQALVVDASGRVLVADTSNNRVRRVELDGTITTIAGNGASDCLGDGGPATSAALSAPTAVAIDAVGRVLVGCLSNAASGLVRRIELDGTITTVAGTGVRGPRGDGGPATSAALARVGGIAVDRAGRIFIAEVGDNRVRRVDVDGIITTVIGTGARGFAGDGGPATGGVLSFPVGIAVDPAGRVLIAEADNNRVRGVEGDGTLTTIAGTGEQYPDGEQAFAGDGGPATSGGLAYPQGVAADALGRVLIADTENNRIRRVDQDGIIRTLAGTGAQGFAGDGGPALDATLNLPSGVAVDPLGRVLFIDGDRIRRVDLDGTITTVAGTGVPGFLGDGGEATRARLNYPQSIAVDSLGRAFIADQDNSRIRCLQLDGTITTFAGDGSFGFSGDGGPAILAQLNSPVGVALDSLGRVLIADTENSRVRRVDVDGTITTVAGTGERGFFGDGGPANRAVLSSPRGVAADSLGRVLVADSDNNRLRRVELDGTITTIAGPVHPAGPGPFTQARLYPTAALVAVPDAPLFSVGAFGRALRVDLSTGVVDVVVGYDVASPDARGQARFAPLLDDARGIAFDPVSLSLVVTEHGSGDLRVIGLDPDEDGALDDPAAWTNQTITTELTGPAGIAYDAGADTFVVVDEQDHCLKGVGRDGVVVDGVFGRCGTAGLFPGFLNQPTHAAVSPASGALYIADTGNHRVLRVDDDGLASLVIGDGSVSSAGEGSPARLFPVNAPRQLAVDRFGNLYVASTTTLRLVENVDGDDDADGDDRVTTIFGGGARDTFPASDTFCLNNVAVGDDDRVFAADACQGFLIELRPAPAP